MWWDMCIMHDHALLAQDTAGQHNVNNSSKCPKQLYDWNLYFSN